MEALAAHNIPSLWLAPGGQSGCVGGSGASSDGLVWGEARNISFPKPQRYDCHTNVFYDERQDDYLFTTRNYLTSPELGRCVGVATSAAGRFADWSSTRTVERGSQERQLYSQITFPFYNIYLGLVMVYDVKATTVSNLLSWSKNGMDWFWTTHEAYNGTQFIERGHPGR